MIKGPQTAKIGWRGTVWSWLLYSNLFWYNSEFVGLLVKRYISNRGVELDEFFHIVFLPATLINKLCFNHDLKSNQLKSVTIKCYKIIHFNKRILQTYVIFILNYIYTVKVRGFPFMVNNKVYYVHSNILL